MFRCVIFLFAFSLLSTSYGYEDNVVTLLNLSSSGRSLYLNRGEVDGVRNEEYAVLFIKQEEQLAKFSYKPVAKVRSIKILNNESVWVAYQVMRPQDLVKSAKFLFLRESSLLQGRKDLTVKRTELVTKNDPTSEVKDFLLEGDSLSKRQEKYTVIEKTKKKEAHQNEDVDLIDVGQYEDRYGDGRLFVDGLYKSPQAEEFRQRRRVQTFEKMVVAFFKKVNDPSYTQDRYVVSEQDSSLVKNAYKKNLKSELDDYSKRKKLFERLRKKGARWSKDYSDRELSDILATMEEDYEVERRRTLLAYSFNYQAYISFGLNLINNENINDPETTEQSKYDIEIAAETHFFKRFKQLKSLTVELSGRRAQDAFFGGTLNARSSEYSLAGHINWYPFRRPSTVNANIIYVGMLMRYGLSFLTNVTNDERGNYQIFSIPGFRGGYKFNFSSEFGLRVTAAYEQIRAERIVRNNDGGTLPNRARYYDGKLAIGISKFF